MRELSDLELVRACAEAMEFDPQPYSDTDGRCLGWHSGMSAGMDVFYNPLHDDAQCLALVKRLDINIHKIAGGGWNVDAWHNASIQWIGASDDDLNRAICLCVSRLRAEKGS